MPEILKVQDLCTQFRSEDGTVKAVDHVSFHIDSNEIVGFVGESGCGKSTTMLSVMQLVMNTPGSSVTGEILFEGQNLLDYKMNSSQMCSVRGGKISMIFQEPMTSLNPTMEIGEQISEMLRLHLKLSSEQAKARTIELLTMVGIPKAESRYHDYPHRFSGGMRQRVMIAMAASCDPKLIIADEFTTALDVTTQAQVLEMLRKMTMQGNTSLAIVTHNLGMIARYAQRIYVMYAGRVIESGTTKQIFGNPLHPYTRGLLACVPRLDMRKDQKLTPIPGTPPNLKRLPDYCAFYDRCPFACEKCKNNKKPELAHAEDDHYAACVRLDEIVKQGNSGHIFETHRSASFREGQEVKTIPLKKESDDKEV